MYEELSRLAFDFDPLSPQPIEETPSVVRVPSEHIQGATFIAIEEMTGSRLVRVQLDDGRSYKAVNVDIAWDWFLEAHRRWEERD